MDQRFTAVVSYGRRDVTAAADKDAIIEVLEGIESQVNVILAHGEFELWRDIESIAKGERWSEAIYDAIDRAHLLILLLSPSWYRSDHCWNEFRRFIDNRPTLGRDSGILPIQLRTIDPEKLQGTARDRFDELNAYQMADWRELVTTAPSQRADVIFSVLQDTAGLIEARIDEFLARSGAEDLSKSAQPDAAEPKPVKVEPPSSQAASAPATPAPQIERRETTSGGIEPGPRQWIERCVLELPELKALYRTMLGLRKHVYNTNNFVAQIAISADGRMAATYSQDQKVRLWDLDNCSELHCLTGPVNLFADVNARGLAVSDGGRHVISGWTDGSITVWDGESGSRLRTMNAIGEVTSIQLFSDGRRIAAGYSDGKIRFWNVENGLECGQVQVDDYVCVESIDCNGARLASQLILDGNTRQVGIWNIENEMRLQPTVKTVGIFHTGAFFARGTRIAVMSNQGSIEIYDTESVEHLITIFPPNDTATHLAASGLSNIVVSGTDKHAFTVWDGETGTELQVLLDNPDFLMTCLAVSADGQRIVGGLFDGRLRVWDAVTV